jgi:hypothetical protein
MCMTELDEIQCAAIVLQRIQEVQRQTNYKRSSFHYTQNMIRSKTDRV